MKRLVTITVFAVGVFMMSCIKPEDYKPDPMDMGRLIFHNALDQHDQSFIPAEIALKLNILLTEAAKQQKTDLSDIKVTVGTSEVNLKNRYLPDAEITPGENGIYSITFGQISFPYSIWGGNKIRINGIVNIDTKGKLFDELQPGDAWLISVKRNTLTNFTYVIYGHYIYEMSLNEDVAYTITPGSEARTWDLSVQKFATRFNNGSPSNWSGIFSVKQLEGTDLSFSEAVKSSFELNGDAAGKTWTSDNMTLNAEKVVYTPSCSYIMQSGRITTTVEVELSASIPADTAIIELEKTGTGCDRTVYLNYNGQRVKY